jgi:hypothetical protein
VQVEVGGVMMRGLMDSGCSRSILSRKVAQEVKKLPTTEMIVMMNGDTEKCALSSEVIVNVKGRRVKLNCLVVDVLPGYQILLGMDAVTALGGVRIFGNGRVEIAENDSCALAEVADVDQRIQIEDTDFTAKFENGKWEVEWRWREEDFQDTLKNTVGHYPMSEKVQVDFDAEVEEWIREGWLQPYSGDCKAVLPLMAVVQQNKNKVRPVLDYREVNQHVSSHTGESVVCGEKIRSWRQMGTNVKILDLRKAYLQIHVSPKLWKYQVVRYKGKTYCLTRLGFGLNVAPKIMTAVVTKVLSSEMDVETGTDS